ncbi:Uncharacterised protein [BD1-7 clade bacterium]|uniref:Uncharacterized protein n=1 Tax=BD1-7 clade bacterium TaxID=2029982 RepID=A0A5S9MNP3_9GAMM|nr:Uncharacterised protein [BD1-7 clade bacterium]CAA0085386.1 Uncharacterised protein [BD1-7 clade bacterium]
MPIDIALDAFNTSTLKTMRAFISSKGRHIFRLTDPMSSMAVIVDFDHPRGKQAIQQARQRQQAVIAIAREAQKDTPYHDLIWVNKPVTSLTMIAAGEKLHRRFNDSEARHNSTPETPKADWEKLAPKTQWENGNTVSFDITKNPYYAPESTLQGYIDRAKQMSAKKGQQMVIHCENRQLIVDASTNRLYINFKMSVLKALCRFELNRKNTTIRPALNNNRQLEERFNAMCLDKALWEIALMCSRGRLPNGINENTPLQLSQWPIFTRWHIAPHAMRISSVWIQQTATAAQVATQLNIEPYFAYAFLAAATAAGIAEIDSSQAKSTKMNEYPQVAETRKLIKNLMRKLVGA